MITYVLVENHLTDDPDDYMAMVKPSGTVTEEDVIDRMVQQGSTVTRADIVSVLENQYVAIEYLVLDGKHVNTPLANFGVSIKGVFDSYEDTFDPARHQLRAIVSAGKRYRRTVPDKGRATKGEARLSVPNLEAYTDLNTGARNGTLTPGGMGQVTGYRLKFNPADASQGIFFVASDGSAIKVEVLGHNLPRELMFLIPAGLAVGDYTLEVRATVPGSPYVRTGGLAATLTVS